MVKKYRVTYTETRDITAIVEAKDEAEAYDIFHKEREDNGWDIRYSGEATEIKEVKDESSTK